MYLSIRNIRTIRPSKKLDAKFTSPYTVIKALGDKAITYKLDVLDSFTAYNVFYASLFEPADTDKPFEG